MMQKILLNLYVKNNCPLLLGSATPSLKHFMMQKATEKNRNFRINKKKRTKNLKLPDVEIVDLREELKNANKSMISTKLYKEIEKI